MKSLANKYSISKLCKLAGVSRSGYYKWLNRFSISTDRDKRNKIIKKHIVEIHNKYRGTYGRKRICIYLNKILNSPVNHKRVYRLMKELGLQSVIRKKVYKRKFKPSNIMDNLLDRNFTANMPLQRICMDITYIPINKKAKNFYI
ncbi:TPA: IS3 family transposase [Clostridium botulinum]|uniref:IS3 family transposase n=2 Tax=Clostridiaceae TaxID=31979 RepID=UPI000C78CA65|nr:hypothetical protein C7M59_12190 [Clostridium botulinum]HBJ2613239.1 IS3 family transposase [Clostridium botulinum]HBJ2615630.1 IS3 family transposase [Clostridium botulinum]